MASVVTRNGPQIQTKAPLLDFAPDADPITPGIMLDCSNLYPTVKGYRAYPSPVRMSSNNLDSFCLGAFGTQLGGTTVIVAGTALDLYVIELSSFMAQGLS